MGSISAAKKSDAAALIGDGKGCAAGAKGADDAATVADAV